MKAQDRYSTICRNIIMIDKNIKSRPQGKHA